MALLVVAAERVSAVSVFVSVSVNEAVEVSETDFVPVRKVGDRVLVFVLVPAPAASIDGDDVLMLMLTSSTSNERRSNEEEQRNTKFVLLEFISFSSKVLFLC